MYHRNGLTLGSKIVTFIMGISMLVLLFATVAFSSYEYMGSRKALVRSLTIDADMIADVSNQLNTGTNLNNFSQLLNLFDNRPEIVSIAIYDAKKQLVSLHYNPAHSTYVREEKIEALTIKLLKSKPNSWKENIFIANDTVSVFSPIMFNNNVVGAVHLTAKLTGIINYLSRNIMVSLVIFVFSLLIALILSLYIKNKFVQPYIQFIEIMKHVSNNKDYSMRVALQDPAAEIEILADGFNDMLDQIQYRDKQLKQVAYFDSLTKASNRLFFEKHLEYTLEQCKRNNKRLTVLFLDIDNFKYVNDTYGHHTGDALLIEAANRLRDCLRKSDCVSHYNSQENEALSRLGGDEFTILLSNDLDDNTVTRVAQRIIVSMNKPIEIDANEILVSVSLGIASYPSDGETTESLIQAADSAMYLAKERGKNQYQFYDKLLNEAAMKKLTLTNNLKDAIHNDELYLLYQPQFNIKTGEITGAEALIRWNHPTMGTISPAVFIPLAETSNIIFDIGRFLITEVCEQIRQWQTTGFLAPKISINLSAKQFTNPYLLEEILRTLSRNQLQAKNIGVELTESLVMDDVQLTLKILQQLQQVGIDIAIDDFGTGYCSLRYLAQFPINTLKIDRSFVDNLDSKKDSRAIVETIVTLAKKLNLSTVAEGVERKEEYDLLDKIGCNAVQGYLTSRPISAEKFTDLLLAQQSKNFKTYD